MHPSVTLVLWQAERNANSAEGISARDAVNQQAVPSLRRPEVSKLVWFLKDIYMMSIYMEYDAPIRVESHGN